MSLLARGLSGVHFESARHVQRARQELVRVVYQRSNHSPAQHTVQVDPSKTCCHTNGLLWCFSLCASPSSCIQQRALAVGLHALQRDLCGAKLCASSTVRKLAQRSRNDELLSWTAQISAQRHADLSGHTSYLWSTIVGTSTLFVVCRSSKGSILGAHSVTLRVWAYMLTKLGSKGVFCVHTIPSKTPLTANRNEEACTFPCLLSLGLVIRCCSLHVENRVELQARK
jgi:hypothetical protein